MTNDEHRRQLEEDWFAEYKKLGGRRRKKTFLKHLPIFFDLIIDAFAWDGPDSEEEAFEKWTKYIRSYNEAVRYFRAIDTITTIS